MEGKTLHEIDLARDDQGATAGILGQMARAVKEMQATPGIRLNPWHQISFQHSATTAEEVETVAAGIGAIPQWNAAGTHYEATRHYGPNVAYTVVFITREHMDAYTRHWAKFPDGDAPETQPEPEPEPIGAAA